jgi:hypothetical protein
MFQKKKRPCSFRHPEIVRYKISVYGKLPQNKHRDLIVSSLPDHADSRISGKEKHSWNISPGLKKNHALQAIQKI